MYRAGEEDKENSDEGEGEDGVEVSPDELILTG
jgi:hypothetical protein